jgi:DNA polymerase-4
MLVVPADRVREFLDPLPVGRVWGIGPVAQAQLAAHGFSTIGELARVPESRLREALGGFGLAVAALARGEDVRRVEPLREARSYGEEHTFAHDVRDRRELEAAMRAHAEAVARRLRRDALRARGVSLKLKLARALGGGRFPLVVRQTTLSAATDDGLEIANAARSLLDRAALSEPVRLVGVAASRLEPADDLQPGLFDDDATGTARRERLNRALDAIRERFGPAALQRGGPEVERAGLSHQVKRGE